MAYSIKKTCLPYCQKVVPDKLFFRLIAGPLFRLLSGWTGANDCKLENSPSRDSFYIQLTTYCRDRVTVQWARAEYSIITYAFEHRTLEI